MATFCAGRTWPPYELGGIPGVTAVSTDKATIALTNQTDRTYYYRVSGWQETEFETCVGLAEHEAVRGPIAPAATESLNVDPTWRESGVRVTVAFWEESCGESCSTEPVTAIAVELSPTEPVGTDAP